MTRTTILGWAATVVAGISIVAGGWAWSLPGPLGWPFVPTWAVTAGLAVLGVAVSRRRPEPVVVLAAMAITGSILVDLTFLEGHALRDLDLYLKAGLHFRLGQPVYLDGLVSVRPPDPADYPFVYPPPTLPVAAVLSMLPAGLVTIGWLAGMVGAALLGLHRIGLRGWWLIAFLAWPPLAEGLYVGNVAVLLFLLFAIAPWSGVGLVVGPLLKLPSAVLSLWLIAERRWRDFVLGLLIVAALVVVSLPLTGLGAWTAWLDGLTWFARSQPLVPSTFYGIALDRYLPALAVSIIGFGLLGLASLARGRPLLARLGVVSVVVSPSLYAHGFMVALPALLELRAIALWTALAFTAAPLGPAWFVALAIVVAGWFVPGLQRGATGNAGPGSEAGLHPLGQFAEPWPDAPADGRARLRDGLSRTGWRRRRRDRRAGCSGSRRP